MTEPGASFFEFDPDLIRKIKSGCNDIVKSMLTKDLVKASDKVGTLLHHAAQYRNDMLAQHLIEVGSVVDAVGNKNKTPLMLAVQKKHIPSVKVLLEAGASIDVKDNKYKTVVGIAFDSRYIDSEVLKLLFDRVRAATLIYDEFFKRLLKDGLNLYRAVLSKDVQLVKSMLNRADVKRKINSKGYGGNNALHLAADTNQFEIVKLLIDNGADIHAINTNCGNNALYLAARNRNCKMMQYLLELGANPNIKNILRLSPLATLRFSTRNDNHEEIIPCAELLLQHGALTYTKNRYSLYVLQSTVNLKENVLTHLLVAHMTMIKIFDPEDWEKICSPINEKYLPRFMDCVSYHKTCKQILAHRFFDTLTLLDLLTASEDKMRLLVRNKTFVPEVQLVCFENKLKDAYPYYYNTLMKHINKASELVKLEEQAILLFCKIFNCSYNKFYLSARMIIKYLSRRDLELLSQV